MVTYDICISFSDRDEISKHIKSSDILDILYKKFLQHFSLIWPYLGGFYQLCFYTLLYQEWDTFHLFRSKQNENKYIIFQDLVCQANVPRYKVRASEFNVIHKIYNVCFLYNDLFISFVLCMVKFWKTHVHWSIMN